MNKFITKAALLLLAGILLSGLKLSAQDPDFYIYLCFRTVKYGRTGQD